MDPITALGIAANVAQFLDFGSRLVSLTKEVAGEGVTVDVAHLSIITSDLVDINISIQRELQPASTNPANKPIPEEEALYDLAKQCNEVAMKLIACLQSVTSQGNSNRIWQSVWQALRTIWNKDELDGLARKLVEYREQLSLRILLLLNSHRAEQNDRLDATILDALHFRAVNARRTAIPPAHQKTFQWAFNGSMGSTKRWDSLHDWLRGGSGCYWINGKAGSGKSTLMKFLHESSETTRLLKAWAGGSELIVASFFFWYAGTSLQKSQAGMLRSLLLEVLTRRPFLIPVLFPDVCRSILSKQLSGPIELSFSELLKAFSTFVASVSNGVKVCFIIDGLDEYDGDPNELAELLSGSTNSHSVKILLSSRPIPACVQAFSNCPSLRLQDLTHKDVVHYVEEKLGRHRLMLGLEMNEPGSTKQLVNAISSKASGVLLWVVLAVRSLIGGLQDYDTTPDLLQKLEELPPDLEKLYDHMLGSMNPRNRCQVPRFTRTTR
ncbi:hypothetical protein DL98DRAFT_550080 [Cadophora sp. DSE1049]|nr:hypothetical protein DL98DRAFT_550080 [Cadophora sp. DSE1049]